MFHIYIYLYIYIKNNQFLNVFSLKHSFKEKKEYDNYNNVCEYAY